MADTTNTPATPVTGSTPAPAAKKPRGDTRPAIYPTRDAAVTEAAGRTEGHRRVFSVKLTKDSEEKFVIANHPHQAAYFASLDQGGVIGEEGKSIRAGKPVGVDAIMASVNSLPEADRKAVMEQLAKLMPAAAPAPKPSAKK
jgi:hypothetical protein